MVGVAAAGAGALTGAVDDKAGLLSGDSSANPLLTVVRVGLLGASEFSDAS